MSEDEYQKNLDRRIRRAESWLHRAESEQYDSDAAFIFYWIAFNALYAEDSPETHNSTERANFKRHFVKVLDLDAGRSIYDSIWQKFSGPIRLLLDNQYLFEPFWKHHNGIAGYEDWQGRFETSKRQAQTALGKMNARAVLTELFGRLYVLRNQLVHGGATWNGSVNRPQVRDGAAIMAVLVPAFVELMKDNPQEDWGKPYYPVVD